MSRNIAIDPAKAPKARITGDTTRIQQVLANLLSNAIKFSKPGSKVSIAIERTADDGLTFVVRDTGIGIAPADMERIFEPFVQADDSAARRFGGMGLGPRHLAQDCPACTAAI